MSGEKKITSLEKVKMQDGTEGYLVKGEAAQIIDEFIEDRKFWANLKRRSVRFGLWVAAFTAVLSFLANWWPWITRMAQAILPDVPR